MSEILRCENLVKRYGAITALNGISISLESGSIVGLLGPNGSGKTTFIKLVNGLLVPDGGTLTILGNPPGIESKTVVSYLPDSIYLNSWMSVKEIINYFSDFFADFRPALAYEMLERLGVRPEMKLKTLSKGNKEKVCLVLAMARNAKLYVLDEPIAGVDPAARDYVISTIINNHNPESCVLISTHLITDVENVLDRVLFLKNGNVVLDSTPGAIREQQDKSVDELFREVFKW